MMTNNYRRLHGMPMVHTKRYAHEHCWGFKLRVNGRMIGMTARRFDMVLDDLSKAVGGIACAIQKLAKENECQKSTS